MTDRPTATSLAMLATVVLVALTACETYVSRVGCGSEAFRCGDAREIRFCESRVDAVEGSDCSKAGLAPSRPFCTVSNGPCVGTHYIVAGQDCEVVEYTRLREGATCSPGTPVFGAP